jgi:hypothetical protein
VFFGSHTIPRLRIQLDQEALAALRNKFREYTKATVMEGTNVWRNVGIHLKGQYGTFQGIDGRPSLTLNFDKYQKGQRFHGLDKIHLNNSAQDPSYLCEMLGRQLFEAAGIPAPRASHARVELNGRDLGLFVLVEGYDKQFLRRHFANPDGNLYDSEFRHDITDPLKKNSGKGPDDHSDLRALAAAAEEPNHTARLARLTKLLDLDRFYTTLALESLMRHHDGYAMGINNYRVYFEPNGRATFLPHGMDLLFFEPRAGLLPDLRGVLAQTVLETQAGRKEFRARCMTLFTNLFLGLSTSDAARSPSPFKGERAGVRGESGSNRVTQARSKLRPMLGELDAKTARHADEAATNLLYRIHERYQQLELALFPPSLGGEGRREGGSFPLLNFDPRGVARLTNWLATVEGGRVTFVETNVAGETSLEIRFGSGGKSALARWEKPVLLTAGTYRFSAKVTADQPVFRGPSPAVALRIWGVSDIQMESTRPEPQTMEFQCTFEVSLENAGEFLLQCEAWGKEQTVTYRFGRVELSQRP